jgi:2-polyprenyl-6-methoxyphenol hydroxylase-like FAD-dependent oxidoreductase
MLPYMGQGGAMAVEDAAALALSLSSSPTSLEQALRKYESIRRDRTTRIQTRSRANDWLRSDADTDWVYGFDAFATPAAEGRPDLNDGASDEH